MTPKKHRHDLRSNPLSSVIEVNVKITETIIGTPRTSIMENILLTYTSLRTSTPLINTDVVKWAHLKKKLQSAYINNTSGANIRTKSSPLWKRLEICWEDWVGDRLGPKNLEAKYQNTAILITPVNICPIPGCCCGCRLTPPPPPPSACAAGGSISFIRA